MRVMLRWWLYACLVTAGAFTTYYFGIFEEIFAKDVTKISFVILSVFVGYSVLIGYHTARPSAKSSRITGVGWFVSESLLGMGMIGTVLGFIIMLGDTFGTIDVSNTETLQDALTSMGLGMSTALYTTATGLVCSLLLKIQLVNLEFDL